MLATSSPMPERALSTDRLAGQNGGALTPDVQVVSDEIAAGRGGRLPAPFAMLIHAPDVARAYEACSQALNHGALPARLVELAFLMQARATGCRYLWGNHLAKARQAGLDESIIVALGEGRPPDMADDELASGWRFLHALLSTHRVPDADYDDLRHRFGMRGVAELVAICGYAGSIAMLLNVRQMPWAGPCPAWPEPSSGLST